MFLVALLYVSSVSQNTELKTLRRLSNFSKIFREFGSPHAWLEGADQRVEGTSSLLASYRAVKT